MYIGPLCCKRGKYSLYRARNSTIGMQGGILTEWDPTCKDHNYDNYHYKKKWLYLNYHANGIVPSFVKVKSDMIILH